MSKNERAAVANLAKRIKDSNPSMSSEAAKARAIEVAKRTDRKNSK